MSQWTRRLLWAERGSSALAGLGFGLILSVIGNFVAQDSRYYLLVGVVAVVFWGIAFFVRSLRLTGIEVKFRPPLPLRTPGQCRDHARRGLVAFVPLYNPQHGSLAAGLLPEERLSAVNELDFEKLSLEQSNMWPTIHAIMCHSSRLEHCWLLSTPQSLPHARLLVEYLTRKKGLNCRFSHGPDYLITQADDALVYHETYQKVRKVLEEARRMGMPPASVVADITTGVRSMTLGMVLACLGEDQDVELVGSQYDDQGKIRGDLFPLIFQFTPEVESRPK